MKTKAKSLVSLLLAVCMVLTLSLGLTGCGSAKATTPRLRINPENNYWEVSYDEGATWESMGVSATGEAGKDGKDGVNGKDGTNGTNGINGANGKNGVDGINGANGKNGTDGINGTNGTNGLTPTIGEDGYWYIGDVCTNIYAGSSKIITVTFKELGGDRVVKLTAGSRVNFYLPQSSVVSFVNWYADEACTTPFDFNSALNADTVVYSKWTYDEAQLKAEVAELTKTVNFGKANCFGTTNCFGSVYVRVLADDHKYYDGAAGIGNYLKGVFTEKDGVVSVAANSGLRRISYTDPMTVINFASAFSSYYEYILRNGLTLPADIAAQRDLAIKYFNTVDTTAAGYHTHSSGGPFTFPSMGVAVVAMGSLLEQTGTERYTTLIKDAYDHVDSAFYNSGMYLNPFYQLCAKFSWFDKAKLPAVPETPSASDVLSLYAYGIDLAKDYPTQWNAFVESALSDGALNASEAKAFAYHYAYQITEGNVYLGVYGSSRAVVSY